jgi:hypothetical protein
MTRGTVEVTMRATVPAELRRSSLEQRMDRSGAGMHHHALASATRGRDFVTAIRRATCGRVDCARRAVTTRFRIPLCGRCAADIEHAITEAHR